jgi:hypothetical protein
MSYTILTIPFNLKEKSEGEFLKKGFVFDDFFEQYFEEKKLGQSFFKIIEFDKSFIKTSVARILLKNAGIDENYLKTAPNETQMFENNSSFITKAKYLNTINSYYEISTVIKTEEIQKKQITSDIANLTNKIVNNLQFFIKKNESQLNFEIEKINLIINRQKSNSNIGFGFFVFHLKWVDEGISSPKEFAKHIASAGEFLRWYNYENDVKTKFFHESCIPAKWNKKLQKLNGKVSFDLTPHQHDEKNSETKGIYFHDIIKELLHNIQNNGNEVDFFDFNKNEKSKPFLLHLFQSDISIENIENNNINDKFLTDIYNSLRIPDKNNVALNLEVDINFSPINPDRYTQLYCINEGAVVIKGNKDLTKAPELINEYFPAFLFALNQKYLFNYMQEKINELPTNDKTGKYEPKDLKKLQETMIYAEFSQIFTSISNYNEIDLFFEKLREQFKIKQLKEDYLDSINGISQITQIKEKETADIRLENKAKEDKRKEENLNIIILGLTIIQVVSIFYTLFNDFLGNSKYLFGIFLIINIAIIIYLLYRRKYHIKKIYERKQLN